MAKIPVNDNKFHRQLNETVGSFVIIFSGIEYLLTNILIQSLGMNSNDGYLILQGMSFPVKIRKLRTIIKHRYKSASELDQFLLHFDDVVKFRDKLMHWTKFTVPENNTIKLSDFGRNPQNVFQTNLSFQPEDIKPVSKWMEQAHTGLFTISFGVTQGETFQIATSKTLLPLEAPPIPKG